MTAHSLGELARACNRGALLPVPWTERETERFMKREAMFRRRGMAPMPAEALADRLATRDRDRDDRRCCEECSHIQRDGGCAAIRIEATRGDDKRLKPIRDLLQRCATFAFQIP